MGLLEEPCECCIELPYFINHGVACYNSETRFWFSKYDGEYPDQLKYLYTFLERISLSMDIKYLHTRTGMEANPLSAMQETKCNILYMYLFLVAVWPLKVLLHTRSAFSVPNTFPCRLVKALIV